MIKQLLKKLLLYSPNFIKNKVIQKLEERNHLTAKERAKRIHISENEIQQIVNSLELNCDVMLHTSLRNIGQIDVHDAVPFLTDLLEKKVDTTKHTLLISAIPYRSRFEDFYKNDYTFDVRTAPIAMGAINSNFGKRDTAYRSLHPSHSVIAIGPQAKIYIDSHHLDKTPFNENSPYFKLIKNNGKILLFGAPKSNTTIHAVEDMIGDLFPIKLYTSKTYKIKVIDKNGIETIVETPLHNPKYSTIRDTDILDDKLKANGLYNSKPLGETEVVVINAVDLAITYLNLIQSGQSIYGTHKVSNELFKKIETLKKSINV